MKLVTAAGEYLFKHERWKRSAIWLSKAYELSGHDQAIGYDLALAQIRAGNLEAAKQLLDQMSKQAETSRLHSLLGELQDRSGDYSAAAHEYYRAAEIESSESNIFDLANFLLQHKKYSGYLPEAVKFFRFGAEKFSHSSKMMVGLGVALYASEEYDEAVRVLCAAVDLAPDDQRPVTFLGMARKVSPELGEQVDRRLEDFARRYPQNAAANYEYAVSLWERGGGEQGRDLDRIEGLLRQAIARKPQWYEPHYQLGLLYESKAQPEAAIGEMQKASLLEPEFRPAHFHLAILYKRIGDKTRAAREAARARQLDNAEIESSMPARAK
jgi:Flp pilus assembly protein TadD